MAIAASSLAVAATAGAQAPAAVEPRLGATAVDTLRAENARLAARVDSMRGELGQHRYAENFVSTALEEQANRFSEIVVLAVAAVGAFTFAGFYIEARRRERKLDAKMKVVREGQQRHRDAVQAQMAESDALMHRAAGNAYVAIASIYKDSVPGLAVAAWLLAAGNFYAIQSQTADRGSRLGAGNLQDALDALNEVTDASREQIGAELQNAEDLWRDAFRMLRSCESPGTADTVAIIHARILELTAGRPTPT